MRSVFFKTSVSFCLNLCPGKPTELFFNYCVTNIHSYQILKSVFLGTGVVHLKRSNIKAQSFAPIIYVDRSTINVVVVVVAIVGEGRRRCCC